jgi:hypothetical protein
MRIEAEYDNAEVEKRDTFGAGFWAPANDVAVERDRPLEIGDAERHET